MYNHNLIRLIQEADGLMTDGAVILIITKIRLSLL